VIAAMPDVCLSPPSPPAGPIPIPYPNFAKASDTTSGSKKVKINGKEVGLKGKSKYKKSNGDEAATRSFGAGVISHSITGAVKHKAGSFDVKVEGSGVVRFMDLTTGNHSNPGDGCTTIDTATPALPPEQQCEELQAKNESERSRLRKVRKEEWGAPWSEDVRELARGNTTITHATFAGAVRKAVSNAFISKYDNAVDNGFGNWDKGAHEEESEACGGHKYKNADPKKRPHTAHTESRIIEEIFRAQPKPTGGTLVLAIDWPGGPAAGKKTTDPCAACQELLCAVSKPEPGCLDILICDENGEPQSMEEKCPPK
jgi:hypothetical protein